MNITKVKINGGGFDAIINDVEISGIVQSNRFYQPIQEWIDAGNTPDPEFTPEEIAAKAIDSIAAAIQSELDKEAQILGYDNIHTAVTYATEPAVAKFQTDGKSFRKWRSNVWAYCYAILADYEAGNIPEPTVEEIIANMPERV